jgi:hypothetical protein
MGRTARVPSGPLNATDRPNLAGIENQQEHPVSASNSIPDGKGRPKTTGLRVFGCQTFIGGRGLRRAIVAVKSRAAAVRAFQAAGSRSMTDSFLKAYGSTTANPAEVEVATSRPGIVFVANDFARDFTAIEPKEDLCG